MREASRKRRLALLLLHANATTYPRGMRERPSSRLLILDGENRLLLFRFEHKRGPLAGQAYWATPGGGVDPGESFEEAACREMVEETGLRIDDPGPQVARREASFQLPTGEMVNGRCAPTFQPSHRNGEVR